MGLVGEAAGPAPRPGVFEGAGLDLVEQALPGAGGVRQLTEAR
jgi:hypothetical protein